MLLPTGSPALLVGSGLKLLIRWEAMTTTRIPGALSGEIRTVAEVPHYGFPIGLIEACRSFLVNLPASGFAHRMRDSLIRPAKVLPGWWSAASASSCPQRMYYTHACRGEDCVNTSPERIFSLSPCATQELFSSEQGRTAEKTICPRHQALAFQKFLGALSGARLCSKFGAIITNAGR